MNTKYYFCSSMRIILKICIILIPTFFLPEKTSCQTDTLICDNGGFENEFLYYKGFFAFFDSVGTECQAYSGSTPITWGSIGQPIFRRFEITTNGIDTLTGLNRTKFGSKALLLNNRYGHNISSGDPCIPGSDVNMIRKRFKVTEDNRDFTIWYSVVLENPSSPGHALNRPFFSIKCDRSPSYDLCFDSNVLKCGDLINDSLCVFDTIQYLDWTCHRIKIPKNMIDSIATLEIVASDCGANHHFGYAYIDGICEECSGSSLGSGYLFDIPHNETGIGIKYKSCNADTITVCGSYELPTECGTWSLDSIQVSGFNYFNVELDAVNKRYCFDLPDTEFPNNSADSCREIFVKLFFSSSLSAQVSQLSNSIEICNNDFDSFQVSINTGICQDNATNSLISDDYYFVRVILEANFGDSWTMTRQLDDPYPDESGSYIIKTGTGPDTIDLGPILIQEGSWDLTVNINGCIFVNSITPPAFCSGCDKFYRTMISNVSCDDNGTVSTADDSWTFDIKVLGDPTKYYTIGSSSTLYYYNSNYTISAGLIGLECISIELKDGIINTCVSNLVVCPPKPCSDDCEIEAYVQDVKCEIEEEEDVFYAYLNLAGSGSAYYCYESFAISDPGNTGNDNYYTGSFSDPIGPFTEDVYIIFYLCSSSACTCDKTCFKILYIPKPECDSLSYRIKGSGNRIINLSDDFMVIPNPVYRNEFIIRSNIEGTDFEILSSSGNILQEGKLIKGEQRIKMEIPSGVYFIRFKSMQGIIKYKKVIKQ